MKRKDVIQLAREHGTGGWQTLDAMVRFGERVAEKAVAEERERSAKVAQQYSCQVGDDAWNIAAAIRARKDNT